MFFSFVFTPISKLKDNTPISDILFIIYVLFSKRQERLESTQEVIGFFKFRSGDFSLKNAQQSDRPIKVDETHIETIIDSDRHSTPHRQKWTIIAKIYLKSTTTKLSAQYIVLNFLRCQDLSWQ